MLFVTGFPGFIGTRLVRELLADDPASNVVCLVEPRMQDAARRASAAFDGKERIEILPGDITDRRLGLAAGDYERLTADTTAVFHLAAIYNLAVRLEIAQKINVEGTGNIVEFCRRCEKLERHNYVSTAYVAGTRKGIVYEHELIMGQWFKNHYESTKFQAEVWVRESMDKVPTAIYRPAIVVGDSETGLTQKFDGPYFMLRAIAVSMRRGWPIAKYGKSEAPFNVVPVDFVASGLMAGSKDEKAIGETFHLVDPEPISSGEVFTLLSELYANRRPAYTIPARPVEMALRAKRIQNLFAGIPAESIQYLNHPVRYDARRASDLLERRGLRLPRFAEYAETIVEFFREHEGDPAFAPAH
ncbi:MAG TPA: SDR family oxidoreductase [Thermoleophilaceae bacterium]|jgi:thioester reductase-like protein|nr:SDR family oxidoreductase [Thermoleophilaceae bacterium]